jgi:hypothetical protein
MISTHDCCAELYLQRWEMCERERSRRTADKQGMMLKERELRKNHIIIDSSTAEQVSRSSVKLDYWGLMAGVWQWLIAKSQSDMMCCHIFVLQTVGSTGNFFTFIDTRSNPTIIKGVPRQFNEPTILVAPYRMDRAVIRQHCRNRARFLPAPRSARVLLYQRHIICHLLQSPLFFSSCWLLWIANTSVCVAILPSLPPYHKLSLVHMMCRRHQPNTSIPTEWLLHQVDKLPRGASGSAVCGMSPSLAFLST